MTAEHAESVWYQVMRFYTNQLSGENLGVLRRVLEDPLLEQGNDGVPFLLHIKAIVFYPNGRGWYGVHPAIRRMFEEAEART